MNFIKLLSTALIIPLCLHAEEFVTFKTYRSPHHSIDAAQALYKGIDTNDIMIVSSALNRLNSIDTISVGVFGDTPLMFAVRQYLQDLVAQDKVSVHELILKDKAKLKEQNDKQFDRLMRTVLKGSLLGLLLHHKNPKFVTYSSLFAGACAGAACAAYNYRVKVKEIETPLIAALIVAGVSMVSQAILSHEPDSDIPEPTPTKTPLEKQREIIELLIKATRDVTIRNNEGINVLEMLIAYGHSALAHNQEVAALTSLIMLKSGKYALPDHALNDIMEQFIAYNQNQK